MVQWAAGERVTASKLSTTRLSASCDLSLTVTTTATDVSGLTMTFNTTRSNVDVDVIAFLDAECPTGGDTGTLVGELVVDGNAQTAQILWKVGTANGAHSGARATVGQQWSVTLASAGSHTIKVRASRVLGTASNLRVNAIHSTLRAIVEDHV